MKVGGRRQLTIPPEQAYGPAGGGHRLSGKTLVFVIDLLARALTVRPVAHVITLGVRDQAASRRFYVDGLGWPVAIDGLDDVTFLELEQGPLLSLWSLPAMAAEIGPVGFAAGVAPPVTLAQNQPDPAAVDAVLSAAAAAGATVSPARSRDWGGYSGYFVDPDGYRWEIAYNPGLVRDADGTVRIGV